jgi:hypothetical protein
VALGPADVAVGADGAGAIVGGVGTLGAATRRLLEAVDVL